MGCLVLCSLFAFISSTTRGGLPCSVQASGIHEHKQRCQAWWHLVQSPWSHSAILGWQWALLYRSGLNKLLLVDGHNHP